MDTYDIYELMIIPPNKKAEMIVEEIKKKDKANLNLVSDLIVLGANLDWQDYEYGWTALHWCANWNRPEILGLLISAGADVNIQRNDGETALYVCAWYNHTDIARMLIDAGADVNAKNLFGETVLHRCAFKNSLEIARMLIDAGADKTIRDDRGKLPYDLTENSELQELLKV